ncbi:LD-carboxypeptidase [Pollutibacter soli]|uniref:S66 peptidase family protein n=1 Tax=Pollutibacter soli TaxID=3034157 RepID=UPI003013F915
MNRKNFIRSVSMSAAVIGSVSSASAASESSDAQAIIPPYLKPGDTIGISAPAGYILDKEIQPAKLKLEEWGFKVRIGYTVGKRDFSFGGTDDQRANDLQIMIDDPNVKAILCARGGYGVTRIMDKLSFTRFREKPKWIIGFSDITALLIHVNRNFNTASIHSKMCNSFPENWASAEPQIQESILSIKQALTGTKMKYTIPVSPMNRKGIGTGQLIGGNLSIIQNLMGTNSEIKTDGKILFLEEVAEYLYSLDRMMMNLQRSKKLDKLSGIVVGGFNRLKPDDPGEEFGRTVEEIILSKVSAYSFPVCFNFPVGHQKYNMALKCGVKHTLTVREDTVELTEI